MNTEYNFDNITPNTIIFFESGNILLTKNAKFEVNELITLNLDDLSINDIIADNYYTNIIIWKNVDYNITEGLFKFDKLYIMQSAILTIGSSASICSINSSSITYISDLNEEQINARNIRIKNDKNKIPYYFKPSKKQKL